MENHIVLSLAPNAQYTRHSEGAFLRLNDGGIYYAYSRFTANQHDDAPSDIVAMISYDEGETWGEIFTVVPASKHDTKNVMSVSLLRMQNGDLGLFYLAKVGTGTNEGFLARSNDEGRTFYKTVLVTRADCPGYYCVCNDRLVRLASGRILVPMSYSRGNYDRQSGKPWYLDARAYGAFVYSDDDGETWQEVPDTIYLDYSNSGICEPCAVELKNGVVWSLHRTGMMRQYESFSIDGGLHWTSCQPSRFTSPSAPMLIKRNPCDDKLYAVWNPIPNYNGRKTSRAGWGRTPLVWAVSEDEGKTWSEEHIIEHDEEHGFCYPAIFFTSDSAMLVAYCAGGPDDGICLARLTIKKIAI